MKKEESKRMDRERRELTHEETTRIVGLVVLFFTFVLLTVLLT